MKTRLGKITMGALVALALFGQPTICFAADEAKKDEGTKLEGSITFSGAWALYPMVVRWAEEFKKANPGVKMEVAAGGAGKGVADALSETVDIGMVSRDLNPAEIEKGAWFIAVTKDAVVPVVSTYNPLLKKLKEHGIKKETFIEIWMKGTAKSWSQILGTSVNAPVNVYTRSDACGAAEIWAKYLGGKQEDLQGTGVYGDPGLAEAVKKDFTGIGYNNIGFAYNPKTGKPIEGPAIVPIDLNGDGKISKEEDFYADRASIVKAIAEGVYPSPPARDLYLVCKGKPKKELTLAFLNWVLTEGQKFVPEGGYVNLPEAKLAEQLKKLK